MIKKLLFLGALLVFMFVAWHTFVIEKYVFYLYPVGETVGYWLKYLIIAILLLRK